MKPLVSVCVPIFNGVSFLDRCLASIEAQTYEPLEVLLVDDQSTDGSREIAERFVAIHSNARLHTNRVRLGLGLNLNQCISLARGEWIKFVFQDDEVTPECIEKMEEAGGAEFPFVVCNRRYDIVRAEDWRVKALTYLKRLSARTLFSNQQYLSPEEFAAAVLEAKRINFVGEPVATMFRSSLIDEVGGFNVRLIQLIDYELWVRIATNYGVRTVDEELAIFRVHSGAASAQNWRLSLFRASVLDPLVLAWSFAFDEEYESYRRNIPDVRSIQREAEELAVQVHILAHLMRNGGELSQRAAQLIGRSNGSFHDYRWIRLRRGEARHPDPSALVAWDELVRSIPRLASLSAVAYARFLLTLGRDLGKEVGTRLYR